MVNKVINDVSQKIRNPDTFEKSTCLFEIPFSRKENVRTVSRFLWSCDKEYMQILLQKTSNNCLEVKYSDHTFPFPCGIPKGQCFTAPNKAATAKL